jgi:cytochrome c oxidase subunit 3
VGTRTASASETASLWRGGVQPFAVSHAKLGMWLFLVSDSLTFAAMLFAYAYLRNASAHWPAPFQFFPSIVVATLMTFCLLTSSYTMVRAVRAAHASDTAAAVRWLQATMAGGVAFLALHLNEWRLLWGEGMTPRANPWGDAMFGATFFTLTGLHMLHVVTGVVALGAMSLRLRAGRTTGEGIEIAGLYWHFVDLVWMFLFPLVYLLSVRAR